MGKKYETVILWDSNVEKHRIQWVTDYNIIVHLSCYAACLCRHDKVGNDFSSVERRNDRPLGWELSTVLSERGNRLPRQVMLFESIPVCVFFFREMRAMSLTLNRFETIFLHLSGHLRLFFKMFCGRITAACLINEYGHIKRLMKDTPSISSIVQNISTRNIMSSNFLSSCLLKILKMCWGKTTAASSPIFVWPCLSIGAL